MQDLTPSELNKKIAVDSDNIILLDVRERWEFDIAHIKNSKLIPLKQLPHRLNELDKNKGTVVICHHGIRSRTAGLFLERNNFCDVMNLMGGIDAWSKEVDASIPSYA